MANVYYGSDVEDFIFGEATYEEACSKKENADVDDIGVDVETDDDGKIDTQVKEEVEAEMEACGVMECVDDPEVACYRIALENEQNYNMVLNAFMQKEISVYESTGEEMVYEAAEKGRFFSAIQAIIDKFWAKIQGVFKAVINRIVSSTKANDSFIKKYKNAKMETPSKAFEFKGYDFPMGYPNFKGVADIVDKVQSDYCVKAMFEENGEDTIKEFRSNFDSIKGKMRGCMCKKDSVSADDFKGELNIAFFGVKDLKDKKAVKLIQFNELIKELERGKTSRENVKKSYDDAKAAITKLKATVKKTESSCKKAKDSIGMQAARCLSDAISAGTTIMSQGLSAKTSAITAKLIQDRTMAAFYIKNQSKGTSDKKTANESAIEDLGINLI